MKRSAGVIEGGSLVARIAFALSRRKVGRVPAPVRIHALSTKLLFGYGQMELAQDVARTVPASIKKLTQVRAAMCIGCPF